MTSQTTAGIPRIAPEFGAHSDLSTLALHGGPGPDPTTGALLTPICQSTTFAQEGVGEHKGYTYTRCGNPSVAALEASLGALEGAPPAICTSTGMSALSVLCLALLQAGDRVLVSDVVYGGTVRLTRDLLAGFGVHVEFVDTSDLAAVEVALSTPTKLVIIESPANPTLKLTDIVAVARLSRAAGATLAVDNTFLTAVQQQPLELGADVSVYSTTKYIEGHNATLGGALVSRDSALLERFRLLQGALGVAQSPFEAYLTQRGLGTLPLRLEAHSRNALDISRWLEARAEISVVHYPGLESFAQAQLAREQQRGYGGIVAFELTGGSRAARTFVRSLELITLAENLGAVQSLITHPASMTHSQLPEDERARLGIGEGLLRLSVGIEASRDLIADLERALRSIGGAL